MLKHNPEPADSQYHDHREAHGWEGKLVDKNNAEAGNTLVLVDAVKLAPVTLSFNAFRSEVNSFIVSL